MVTLRNEFCSFNLVFLIKKLPPLLLEADNYVLIRQGIGLQPKLPGLSDNAGVYCMAQYSFRRLKYIYLVLSNSMLFVRASAWPFTGWIWDITFCFGFFRSCDVESLNHWLTFNIWSVIFISKAIAQLGDYRIILVENKMKPDIHSHTQRVRNSYWPDTSWKCYRTLLI